MEQRVFLCNCPVAFIGGHHGGGVARYCPVVYDERELVNKPTPNGLPAYYAPCGHFHAAFQRPLSTAEIERWARPADRARWQALSAQEAADVAA